MPPNPGDAGGGLPPLGSPFTDQASVTQAIPLVRLNLSSAARELASYLEFETGNEFNIKRSFWGLFYQLFDISHSRKVIASNEEYGKTAEKIKNWFNKPRKSDEDYVEGLGLYVEWVKILEDGGLV